MQDILKSGKLGAIKRMSADFSMNFEPDSELKVFRRAEIAGHLVKDSPPRAFPSLPSLQPSFHCLSPLVQAAQLPAFPFILSPPLTPARPDSNRMIDPEQGGGSLLDQGPYPSVWAMLAMHHHPDNKDKDPRVVSSYQKIYERSGVDAASTWIVSWKGLGDAVCVTDMTTSGYDDACVVVSCEEADLVLSCE